ncbi:MAG: serine/threonine protein kinase [Planctomycetes bacterium]|nr:serine/threonine protein kinase [Planctomycetota bacterium]
MLSPQDESAIDDLLEVWFARRHEGRRIGLDELCAGVPHLRGEVERMLERHMALIRTTIAEPAADADAVDAPAAPPPAARLERLGGYRIRRRIGRGGVGDVYLARQEALDRPVAIKVLHAGHADDAASRLRFRREAEVTAALDHPNIVPVYETGEQDGVLFLVMKLVDGVPIDRAPASRDPVALARMGAAIARALHAAHGVGVVHRDVKPANVLVAGEHPYVVDFGLARGRADVTLTRPGQSPGTLQFMAPEQIHGGAPSIDPRVDVYGLGATLFQCLHGTPPFDAADLPMLMQRILFEEPAKIRVAARARDLDVIVRRALRKEPARRFASALEFANDLDRFAAGQPIRSRAVGPVERLLRRARRHPRTSAVLALATLACLVLGFGYWRAVSEAAARELATIVRARAELGAGDPASARAQLLELPPRRLAEPDVGELAVQVDTRLRLENLLDQLQAERRFCDLEFLAELQREMMAGDPEVAASRPAWVAQILLASYGDRGPELGRLLRDDRAAAFPRTVALLRAPVDRSERALAAAADASDPADAALDAVAVTALLRSRECDPAWIGAELERPVEQTARLVFGRAMFELIRRRQSPAAALLGALVLDERPHPEAHLTLARVAAHRGRLAEARRHLDRARADFARAARTTSLRLLLTEIDIELLHGSVERCRASLAVANERWPGRPEVALAEAHVAALDGDLDRARALANAAVATARAPWTWRRAMAYGLGLRVADALVRSPTGPDSESSEVASIAADARELRERARAAFDPEHEARAEHVLAFLSPDPETYVNGLERVLELEPGDAVASMQFVEQIAAWGDAGLPLAGRLRARAERAVGLAEGVARRRRTEPRCLEDLQLAHTALCGAQVAVALGEGPAARRLGAVAHAVLGRSEEATLRARLEALGRELGIVGDDWQE